MLPRAFVEERFAFYGTGARRHPAAPRPRGSAAVDATNAALGEAVGQLYVAAVLPARGQGAGRGDGRATSSSAFGRRIDAPRLDGARDEGHRRRRSWPTLKVGVGYPDTWLDYSGLRGRARRRVRQRASARSASSYQRSLAKLGQPVDRTEWVHDAADGERGEPAGAERAQLPGGHPAAAVLRPDAPRGHELRRHRRGHRPRDQPQLRRPGRAVRRQRPARGTGGRTRTCAHFEAAAARLVSAVRRLPAVPRPRTSTAS